MPNYIREWRFGPPKTWKTGSIVGTYPRPLLVFCFEPGGMEILRMALYDGNKPLPYDFITPEEFEKRLADPSFVWPAITAIDFTFKPAGDLEATYVPAKDRKTFDNTVKIINLLIKKEVLPFKTIVLDSVTGLSDAIWSHQAVTNSAALADARKWAGNIGMKVAQIIDFLTMESLKCNVVFIFHTEISKDEITQKVTEQPMVYSKLRDSIGRKFSQFFYHEVFMGKPRVRIKPFDLVSGIGCRWPDFGNNETAGPTFNDIYGRDKEVFK